MKKKKKKTYEWRRYGRYTRCSNPDNICSACDDDPKIRPHGPYTELKRFRHYDTKTKKRYYDCIYLGVGVVVSDESLKEINRLFDAEKPSKEEVMDFLKLREVFES